MRKRVDSILRGRVAAFAKLYARKAQRGVEPNDRRFDRKVEKLVKKLRPEELSRLLHEDEDKDGPG